MRDIELSVIQNVTGYSDEVGRNFVEYWMTLRKVLENVNIHDYVVVNEDTN